MMKITHSCGAVKIFCGALQVTALIKCGMILESAALDQGPDLGFAAKDLDDFAALAATAARLPHLIKAVTWGLPQPPQPPQMITQDSRRTAPSP